MHRRMWRAVCESFSPSPPDKKNARFAQGYLVRPYYDDGERTLRYMRVIYQNVFVFVLAGKFEVAGSRQNGLDSSHTVVVVKLCGQLLGTQSVSCDDLHRQVACVHETV